MMKGSKCELRPLMLSEEEVRSFTDSINAGLTTQFLFTGTFPATYQDTLNKWKKERDAGDVLFGIWNPEEFTGVCGLHTYRSIYRSYELRIIIHDPSTLGKGVGTEATALLCDYAFRRLNAHRVWLGVNADNLAAYKCYKRVGFVEEGRLRDELYVQGKYRDAIRMSVLEHEWHGIAQ